MLARLLSIVAVMATAVAIFAATLFLPPQSARAIGAFDVSDVIVTPSFVQFRIANLDRSNDGDNGGYDGFVTWAVISCMDAPDGADGNNGDGHYLITPSEPHAGGVQYNVGDLVTFVPTASARWPVLWDGTPYYDCRAFVYSNAGSNDYASRQSFAIPTGGPSADADGDGVVDTIDACPGSPSGEAVTTTGCALTEGIVVTRSLVQSYNLQQGIANSLDTKLSLIQNALTSVNNGNLADAANRLGAFINEVEAQRGNKLTDAQADELIAWVQELLALL